MSKPFGCKLSVIYAQENHRDNNKQRNLRHLNKGKRKNSCYDEGMFHNLYYYIQYLEADAQQVSKLTDFYLNQQDYS